LNGSGGQAQEIRQKGRDAARPPDLPRPTWPSASPPQRRPPPNLDERPPLLVQLLRAAVGLRAPPNPFSRPALPAANHRAGAHAPLLRTGASDVPGWQPGAAPAMERGSSRFPRKNAAELGSSASAMGTAIPNGVSISRRSRDGRRKSACRPRKIPGACRTRGARAPVRLGGRCANVGSRSGGLRVGSGGGGENAKLGQHPRAPLGERAGLRLARNP